MTPMTNGSYYVNKTLNADSAEFINPNLGHNWIVDWETGALTQFYQTVKHSHWI